MRLHKFLAVISLLILPQMANACYDLWYFFQESTIYRVETKKSIESKKLLNLREWQSMTSEDIPLDDIEKVVYTMSLEEYESFYSLKSYTGDNMFAQWIKQKDKEIMDFILLAKRNEFIRFRYNSLWYYPTMKVGGPTTLEDIIDTSLNVTDERLRTRYMLQAMRAMFTLNRYDECLKLWHEEFEGRPMDDSMRRHAYLYVAGALYHTGEVQKALDIYAMADDIDSIYYIAQLENLDISSVELIEMLYRNNSDNPEVFNRVARIIREEEAPLFLYEVSDHVLGSDSKELLDISLRLAAEGRNAAEWYYTAAYLYYIEGRIEDAYATLALAEKSNPSPYMSDSLRVLRLIFDARYAKLDKKFEKNILTQLRWLEGKGLASMTTLFGDQMPDIDFFMFPLNDYYWSEMMKYIINEMLVPRYFEAGNGVRALQLANYSSYYLFGNNPQIDFWCYDKEWKYLFEGYDTLNTYRGYKHVFNQVDYSTFFFVTIDAAKIDDVLAYVDSADKPKSELERFLNRGSYLDKNFLYDIAGTHCLRNMRYADAESYLNKVDFYYSNYSLNVRLKYDPFELNQVKTSSCDFRLNFARKMASLQRAIESSNNNNTRARYMVDYAIALHNSVNRCWQLTHYHNGELPHMYYSRNWYDDEVVVLADAKAKSMVQEALSIVDDDNLAAELHFKFCNFRTVANEYGSTKYATIVRSQCDNLIDYHGDKLDMWY